MITGRQLEIKGAVYFCASDNPWDSHYRFVAGEAGSFADYQLLVEHTITVELPEGFDPRTAEVKSLEAARDRAKAEYTRTVCEINERINKLLCIENSPEAAS